MQSTVIRTIDNYSASGARREAANKEFFGGKSRGLTLTQRQALCCTHGHPTTDRCVRTDCKSYNPNSSPLCGRSSCMLNARLLIRDIVEHSDSAVFRMDKPGVGDSEGGLFDDGLRNRTRKLPSSLCGTSHRRAYQSKPHRRGRHQQRRRRCPAGGEGCGRRRPHLAGLWYDKPDSQYGRPAAFYHQLQRLDLAAAWAGQMIVDFIRKINNSSG
jgi:hypothetical protein